MSLFQPDASAFHSFKSAPKTIVITGGSSGIGFATARLLSSLNPSHNIAIIDLSTPPADFDHSPSHLLVHTCNLTSWTAQRSGFEAAYKKFGRIDAVFVNAGIAEYKDQFFNDEFDAAFFTVFDNGEPGGGNDTISEVFFDNVAEPSICQFIGADDFPQIPIETGNVLVRP